MPQQLDKPSYLWLYIGVLSIGTVLGYMVGASNSPVVGTAIPSVFGLVAIAIGAVKHWSHPATSSDRERGSEEREGTSRLSLSRHTVGPLGIMLTIFSATYLAAMLGGTEVRAASFRVRPTQFPWPNSKPPQNVEDALDWLAVQQQLIAYGYSPEQVQELYKLPRAKTGQLTSYVPPLSENVQTGPLGFHLEHNGISGGVEHGGVPILLDLRNRDNPLFIDVPKKQDAPSKTPPK
jgi:hypothetical protein